MDFLSAVAFAGFVVAIALVVIGIWKLDMRLVMAGGFFAGAVWLAIGWTTPLPARWPQDHLVTLRLRPVDAATGEFLAGTDCEQIETRSSPPRTYRLPHKSDDDSREDAAKVIAVSMVIELNLTDSLREQLQQPEAHVEIVNESLQVTAPGYRPWHGDLKDLLPPSWTASAPTDEPITIELERE
jgi:hypothetical protein